MKRSRIVCPVLFLSVVFSAAAQVSVSVRAGETAGAGVVSAEWNEKWFGENPSSVYNHNIARCAAFLSYIAYSDVAVSPDDNEIARNYSLLGIRRGDIEFHYDVDYDDSLWGNDQCAFSIASKEIDSARGKRQLVIVSLRGTPLNVHEWLSNLNINDATKTQDSIHKGFARAASIVHTAVISYLLRHRIDPTDAYLLMTGHSRGGAIANLLAKLLLEDAFFRRENMYVYTFASPNVTTDSGVDSPVYDFIWNIVNAEDIVPSVPICRGNWSYRKYGNVRTLANYCNTNQTFYTDVLVRRVNEVFVRLRGREYCPFKTGPFVPIVITAFINILNSDVDRFYSGVKGLHNKSASLLRKVFPEDDDADADDELGSSTENNSFGARVVSWLDKRSQGKVGYITKALADMHSCGTYLSFMLSLDESQAFSDLGYSLVVIQGTEECAVLDAEQNQFLRVIDGRIAYSDLRMPVIASPAHKKRVLVGFPANMDFTCVVTDETVLPTKSSVVIEHYTASGLYLDSSEKEKVYPRLGTVYAFGIGAASLNASTIAPEKIKGKNARTLIRMTNLRPSSIVRFSPEVSLDTDGNASAGFHWGNQFLYGSFLFGQRPVRFGTFFAFSFGIGNQMSIIGPFKYDTEAYVKCVWVPEAEGSERKFNCVPSMRASLSLKVVGRLRIFAAGAFDFEIEDFNEAAFSSDVRGKTLPSFGKIGTVSVVPSVQFGIRF